jgi:hypothetical protein
MYRQDVLGRSQLFGPAPLRAVALPARLCTGSSACRAWNTALGVPRRKSPAWLWSACGRAGVSARYDTAGSRRSRPSQSASALISRRTAVAAALLNGVSWWIALTRSTP